jgi:flavodoxin
MRTVVVYDSKFGNTEKIADAIARGVGSLGTVSVMDTAEAVERPAERPDLLLVGGPTQKRAATPALRDFIDPLPPTLDGVPVAAFDTRYRGSTWLMGSAAADAAKVLRKSGTVVVAPPTSFYIKRGGPLELQGLEPGEIERAEEWGRSVGTAISTGRS